MTISRRTFLTHVAGGALTLGIGVPTYAEGTRRNKTIEKRPLGKTGLDVTILGLGCATIGYSSQSVAQGARIVEACIDAGINYIDCASSYGDAEVKVGEVMKTRRSEVILATKTLERKKEESWREINRSLERLKVDFVDLLQIHSINTFEELDRVMGTEGSLASAQRAKEQGMCRHIGITGHTRPEVIKRALERFGFATALVPISSTDVLVNDFGPVIFPVAREKRTGIIAMKVLGAGRVTAYASQSLRYAMSMPVSTAIVGMGSIGEVRDNIAAARSFTPMTPEERAALIGKTREFANTSVLWWKRT
jgi:uncharacterized protein